MITDLSMSELVGLAPIVDTHVHLGRDVLYGRDTTVAQILERMDRNGVDAAVVQPGHDNTHPDAVARAHDAIAAFAKANPGRIFGLCATNPHREASEYRAEVRRCIHDL